MELVRWKPRGVCTALEWTLPQRLLQRWFCCVCVGPEALGCLLWREATYCQPHLPQQEDGLGGLPGFDKRGPRSFVCAAASRLALGAAPLRVRVLQGPPTPTMPPAREWRS